MKYWHTIAFIVLVAGGLAWGIYGLFDIDVVYSVLGSSLAKVVYILVGIAAIYEVATHKWRCKECMAA